MLRGRHRLWHAPRLKVGSRPSPQLPDFLMEPSPELRARQEEFARWCREVRDPASAANEGIHRIETSCRRAIAEYRIAPLPNGRWAVSFRSEYRCGDMHGSSVPWTDYSNRDECLEAFLKHARRHFGLELVGSVVSASQWKSRLEMNSLLSGGLFGFIEPAPVPSETSEHDAV